ncbi:radical SAM family heme chaperone HemW [bacterium]|nr:radical SAM family heme chaperone HemW [bacterium]
MNEFALYFHYPFCLNRCYYCNFTSSVLDESVAERYRQTLIKELLLRSDEPPWKDGTIRSIYIGGGTPSLMPAEYVNKLLLLIRDCFNYPPDIEVTIEANPGAIDAESLSAFHEAGINRISIGAQSLIENELRQLSRIHTSKDIHAAVLAARQAGIYNISLDLMYGFTGQSVNSFTESLNRALELDIKHLSTYALSIEGSTEKLSPPQNSSQPTPDPDLAADQYDALCSIMKKAGFDHYELTNFALSGFQSHHNWTYWRSIPYLGLGVSAHSFDGKNRSWNIPIIDEYNERLERDALPQETVEILSMENVQTEQVYLGLRTSDGLTMTEFEHIINPRELAEMVDSGFLIVSDGTILVPEERWLLLDDIVLKLLSKCDKIA